MTMNGATLEARTVKVPGVALYVEVRGSGPEFAEKLHEVLQEA
jgi:hypothetical protein